MNFFWSKLLKSYYFSSRRWKRKHWRFPTLLILYATTLSPQNHWSFDAVKTSAAAHRTTHYIFRYFSFLESTVWIPQKSVIFCAHNRGTDRFSPYIFADSLVSFIFCEWDRKCINFQELYFQMGNVVVVSFPIFLTEKTQKSHSQSLKSILQYLKSRIVSPSNLPQRLQIKRQQTLTFCQEACLIKGCNMCERNEPSLKHSIFFIKLQRNCFVQGLKLS